MNEIIGDKLKKMRATKGWSQEQVAESLHLSQSAYARMEKGESNSWAAHLTAICELFEIQPEELVSSQPLIVNAHQQGGHSNNAFIINQLSEKLIEQYEARLLGKEDEIQRLRAQLEKGA